MSDDILSPVLRVLPEPADINMNGHIFGGWVLAMMDRAGGIAAGRIAEGRCATVAIEAMQFIAPILLGDLISITQKWKGAAARRLQSGLT